jgi:hypothetical protein
MPRGISLGLIGPSRATSIRQCSLDRCPSSIARSAMFCAAPAAARAISSTSATDFCRRRRSKESSGPSKRFAPIARHRPTRDSRNQHQHDHGPRRSSHGVWHADEARRRRGILHPHPGRSATSTRGHRESSTAVRSRRRKHAAAAHLRGCSRRPRERARSQRHPATSLPRNEALASVHRRNDGRDARRRHSAVHRAGARAALLPPQHWRLSARSAGGAGGARQSIPDQIRR